MIRELQLRILPEQAASEQSIAVYVAREQSMDIRSIKSVRVLKRSIDARQRTVMVNLKVRVYIDEFPQDDEFLSVGNRESIRSRIIVLERGEPERFPMVNSILAARSGEVSSVFFKFFVSTEHRFQSFRMLTLTSGPTSCRG